MSDPKQFYSSLLGCHCSRAGETTDVVRDEGTVVNVYLFSCEVRIDVLWWNSASLGIVGSVSQCLMPSNLRFVTSRGQR